MKSLDEVYDLYNMTCEKHPDKKWPHQKVILGFIRYGGECPGPGVPKRRASMILNNPTEKQE